jgi:hypothetical protein
MSKVPKVSFELLEQILLRLGDIAGGTDGKIIIPQEKLKPILKKYMRELEVDQPAIYDWVMSSITVADRMGINLGSGGLVLFVSIFSKALKEQKQADDLKDLFNSSPDVGE